ncbi:hypothetical protein TIFTF001_035585 [Ficus carica]|uniref:non-specific serine/threonine protein kinase n=1 Tax=Ficus carica TaxID=3494 RepID=A0AA88E1V0_FICCA|nr:hypothetical protein TIFTF001_035585 [Ficus carica]
MHKKANPRSILPIFFLFLFLKTHTSHGADTISANKSLSGDQTIVSAHGIFELGFFKPDGPNPSKPSLWESFDHPTDTWLPGNKMGYNKKTGEKRLVTSWRSPEDPAPGLFTLELFPSDNSFGLVRNKSDKFWSSGAWDEKLGAFSLTPVMKVNGYYNFSYVSNDNESYLKYTAFCSSCEMSRIVMHFSGQVRVLILTPNIDWRWFASLPTQLCQVYAACGAYGTCDESSLPFCSCLKGFEQKSRSNWDLEFYSDGCFRKTELQCGHNSGHGERERFLKMQNILVPKNEQFVQVENIISCESACLNNCSCTAYSFNSSGCSIWMGDLLDLQQLKAANKMGRTLYIRLAASEFQTLKHKKGLIGVVVGSAAGSVVLLVLILLLMLRRKKKAWTGTMMEGSLLAFSCKDLRNSTKNFSEKLGGGGFGSVFKGILSDSTVIAVKKLESIVQGEKQFRAEVSTIGTIQHVNLVRLRGFCSQGTKKLLVYDYMSNGSLASHLFHGSDLNILDWKTRYQIAIGTARGLAYLHEKCRECIIHCDIKPENVLLDAEFCPKVADFGLAKLIGREFSRVLTTMRGTRGYLAPEWIAGVAITSKANVYSFGMMLFELVSGMRNSKQIEANGKLKYYPSMATSVVVEGGDVVSLLDDRLEGNADEEEVERVCKVAVWCIQDDEAHRPSMGEVVQILEGIVR